MRFAKFMNDSIRKPKTSPLRTQTALICTDGFLWLGILVLAANAAAQVRIDPGGKRFKGEELISASIVNNTDRPITVCLEAGQWSVHNGHFEPTPIPFFVQQPVKRKWKHLFRRRWQTLLIGPDIGRDEVPVTLEPGKSYEFPFRLTGQASHKLCLLLFYWKKQSTTQDCNAPKGMSSVVSQSFQLEP